MMAQRLREQHTSAAASALDALKGRKTVFYLHSCAADLLAAASLLGLKAGYCGNGRIPLELLNRPNHHIHQPLNKDGYCSLDTIIRAMTRPLTTHDDGTPCDCGSDGTEMDEVPFHQDPRC